MNSVGAAFMPPADAMNGVPTNRFIRFLFLRIRYLPISISAASLSVEASPTLPGKMT